MFILVVDAVVAGVLAGLIANSADGSGVLIALASAVAGSSYFVAWFLRYIRSLRGSVNTGRCSRTLQSDSATTSPMAARLDRASPRSSPREACVYTRAVASHSPCPSSPNRAHGISARWSRETRGCRRSCSENVGTPAAGLPSLLARDRVVKACARLV
jgi:hypothetical protein